MASLSLLLLILYTIAVTELLCYMMCSCIWLWRCYNKQSSRARHD